MLLSPQLRWSNADSAAGSGESDDEDDIGENDNVAGGIEGEKTGGGLAGFSKEQREVYKLVQLPSAKRRLLAEESLPFEPICLRTKKAACSNSRDYTIHLLPRSRLASPSSEIDTQLGWGLGPSPFTPPHQFDLSLLGQSHTFLADLLFPTVTSPIPLRTLEPQGGLRFFALGNRPRDGSMERVSEDLGVNEGR
ncbi:hypothetical protein F5878DRAFT_662443 [Lentinula raphanica]|uniref:Uncharacterized protein n=1 Tax=Lentinula raphanica TaxID=153919 RepID=A0AA38P6L3_9AGAR|nr:hypothetical protein F5878DRAFT_662443 [Lentinula raphanica]